MSVVLLILKIIGIILLVLIGIVLLLIGLLLFVPVRYSIAGEIEDKIRIQGRLTWLFPVISYVFSFEDQELEQQLRILGFLKKKKKETAQEVESDLEEDFDEVEEGFEAFEDDIIDSTLKEDALDSSAVEIPIEAEENPGAKSKRPSLFGKIRTLIAQVKVFFLRLKERMLAWKETFTNIKTLILDETNQKAVKIVGAELFYLLKHFRFRKIQTELNFSMGDPATTGWVLGILSLFPFLYQYEFHIYPDFETEEMYVKGTFDVKGKIRIWHLLVSVIRIIKVKECRILIKKIMK